MCQVPLDRKAGIVWYRESAQGVGELPVVMVGGAGSVLGAAATTVIHIA